MPWRTVAVVLDDRLLIEELLVGLDGVEGSLHTSMLWYFRSCRAAAAGAGGQLSGPFAALGPDDQESSIASLLTLRDDIGLPEPRLTVPAMAELATRHTRLNLLNLEAVAAAQTMGAIVWLSPPSASGILPGVLDAEEIPWELRPL